MSNFMALIMQAQKNDGVSNGSSHWSAVAEYSLVTFFVVLIPKMIGMNPQDMHWYDFWEPILSAALGALYGYIRVRGITLEERVNEHD